MAEVHFAGKEKEQKELRKRRVITLFENTGRGQGLAFREQMLPGDFFYLCHGNTIKLLGQITSSFRKSSKKRWVEREYRVIKECAHQLTKFTGPQKKWTPNYNSTCALVPTQELHRFEWRGEAQTRVSVLPQTTTKLFLPRCPACDHGKNISHRLERANALSTTRPPLFPPPTH
jgi:hypothetical protein